MTSRTITCSECGNNDNSKMFITEDGRYSVCNICGARTKLYSDYVIQEHTGYVEVEGIAGKQARIDSASHLIKLGEFDRAKKLFERLTDDYSDSSESWYGQAQAVSCDFTATHSNAIAVPALEHAMHNARPDSPAYRAAQGARDFLVRKLEKEGQIQTLTTEIAKMDREIATGPAAEWDVQLAYQLEVNRVRESVATKEKEIEEERRKGKNIASMIRARSIGLCLLSLAFLVVCRILYGSGVSLVLIGLLLIPIIKLFNLLRGDLKSRNATRSTIDRMNLDVQNMKGTLAAEHQDLARKEQSVREKLKNVSAKRDTLATQLEQAQAEYAGMAQYPSGV